MPVSQPAERPISMAPICSFCTHLIAWPGGQRPTCAAYPQGIPDSILTNRVDHRQPQPGDHGLQYVPTPGTAGDVYPDMLFHTNKLVW